MEFYILNQNEEVTATLSTDSTGEHTPVYSAVVDEKLGSYDTLELSIPSGVEHDLDIKEEYYIVFEDIKGFREYIINEVVDVDDGEINKTITAELSSIELLDEIIQTNLTGNNPTLILTSMLKNTRWTIGNVDPSIYNSAFTEETEMVSVLEGIDLLSSSFNAEVSFSYAVAGNKITKRFVNLHKQMGANNGKRFEVDKDVTSIKRTIDTSSIKTAIIPFGAEPEEGKARLSIKDLVWSKAAGNPVDKPKGQEWIGDPTALAQWGKNNADGSRRHRFLAQEINVETAAELATMAWVQLGQYTKPKTTYEAVAMDLYTLTGDEDLKHEYVNLGDTVVITDYYFAQPLVVQTRVSELKRDLLEPLNNDLVFGDSLELFSTSKQADRLEKIKKELSNRIELVRQSADGKSDTYMGSDEPISPNEKDMWYRPHPTIPNETQFLIFNGLTWDIVLDTSNLDSVGKEVIAIIEQADRDREQAEADFESAKTAAKAYTDTKASEFDTKVEAVKTDLAATKIKADKAITDSEKAIAEAGFAKVDATTAKQNAVTAISTAETAKTNAGTALTAAQTAVSNSGTALTNAQTALDRVGEVEEETGGLKTSYDALTQTIGLKADKTTVNSITQTVTQHGLDITANATAVALKADKTAVDTINQTVTKHTTDIKATSDGLALKSDKSVVDSINNTVNTHTSQIKATSDGLALKADSSLVNAVKGTVDTHTTQITATSNGLALKADSSLVNTINGTVNTHTGQISANSTAIAARLTSAQVDSLVAAKKYVNETTFNATANGLSSSITQVSKDLSNLEIEGRNYFNPATNPIIKSGGGTFTVNDTVPYGFYGVGDQNQTLQARLNNVITGNGLWTVSFDLKGNQNGGGAVLVDICDLGVTQFQTPTNNDYSRFSLTVNVTNYGDGAVYHFVDIKPTWSYVWVKNIKVEKGGKATGFTLAPDDMATLEKFTALNATVDGIQTTVGTKASQSQVTQLATQVSTKVESATYNSKMTQLDSAINLRVVQKDVTDAILTDKTIKDTRATNELPSWYFANYPKQTIEEFKQRTTMGVAGTATYGQLTTKVIWNSTSGGVITQIFSSSDGVFQRQGNSGATAWLAWDKIAEAGKLISQINVSTEGILLQGKRIQLDGDVTMTSAFVTDIKAKSLEAVYADIATLKTKVLTADVINSTMLKSDTALITKLFATDANVNVLTAKTAFVNSVKAVTISADKITAGTLNASNVNIINMNASNISTGTLSGVSITSPFNYVYSGTIRNVGVTTIATGDISMTGKFSNGSGTTFLKLNADGLYGDNLTQTGAVRSLFKLNGDGVTVVKGGDTAYYRQDGVFFESGGRASISYYSGNARIEVGSYNGVSLGANHSGTFLNRLSVGGGQDGLVPFVDVYTKLNMRNNPIENVASIYTRFIRLTNQDSTVSGSKVGNTNDNWLEMGGKWGTRIGHLSDDNSTIYTRITVPVSGSVEFHTTINMNGNGILNQSDRRLKKNITVASEDSLNAINRWSFVDYEWISPDKTKGRHLGLISQDTPEISVYDAESDIYNIDSSKQNMINSHAIQQMHQKFTSEIKKLEDKINEMERKYNE